MRIPSITAPLIFAAMTTLVSLGIYFGFNEKPEVIRQCTVTIERYVKAHYSETIVGICLDHEGNSYSCMETDYWSKPASEIATAIFVNESFILPKMPEKFEYMRNHSDFDYFREYTKTNLSILTDKSTFNEVANKNELCIANLNQVVAIKYWYKFPRSTEFLINEYN